MFYMTNLSVGAIFIPHLKVEVFNPAFPIKKIAQLSNESYFFNMIEWNKLVY